MKIAGYINYGYRPPAPFVTASILLKELNLKARLPLLVDTGASNTIIMWRDVERLGIDVSKLKPEREFSGKQSYFSNLGQKNRRKGSPPKDISRNDANKLL